MPECQVSLEGMGFLQARQKSKLPVMVEDVFGLMQEALDHAYAAIDHISWEKAYFRRDIGQDILRLIK